MLVALAIVSLIAVMSWQGLNTVIRIHQRIEHIDHDLGTLRAMFHQLAYDLQQVPDNHWQQLKPNQKSEDQPENHSGKLSQNIPLGNKKSETSNTQDTLNAVVQTSLASIERVFVNHEGLFILNIVLDAQHQAIQQRIHWRLVHGALERQVLHVASTNNQNNENNQIKQNNLISLSDSNLQNHAEDKLNIKALGICFWIDGRGWDSEMIYGDFANHNNNATETNHPLWGSNPKNTNSNNPPNSYESGAGVYRVKGVRIRLLMPSGEMFSRIFWVGTASWLLNATTTFPS